MSNLMRQLKELGDLWAAANDAAYCRIPALCDNIANLASRLGWSPDEGECGEMRRILALASSAARRVRGCVEIQVRTGTYSTAGDLAAAPHIATSQWEG